MRRLILMLALVAPGGAVAQERPAGTDTDAPSTAADRRRSDDDDDVAELGAAARGVSADRLRAMLGAHGAGPPLHRDDVLDTLDDRHPKARAALLDVDRARGERTMAWGAFEPAFVTDTKGHEGYYGYLFSDNVVHTQAGPVGVWGGYRLGIDTNDVGQPDYYGEAETLRGGEWRVGASLALLDGLVFNEDLTDLQVARLGVDLAQARQDAILVMLRRKATTAWADWVAAGRTLALERALEDIAEQRQRAVDARIELGDLAAIERVRARQILAQREAAVAEAFGSYLGATEVLALYLRTAEGETVRVTDARLPDRVDAPASLAGYRDDPLALARQNHPMLRALRADLAARGAEARLAAWSQLPDVHLSYEYAVDQLGEGQPKDSLVPPTHTVGLKAKVPLLLRKDRGKARATAAKRDKAEADLVWATQQVEADVRAALAAEEAALVAWRAAAEQVELALELQEAEQRRFDVGDIDLLRLWQVEQSTAKAIRTEIKAWKGYQVAVADLEAAVGRPVDEGPRP